VAYLKTNYREEYLNVKRMKCEKEVLNLYRSQYCYGMVWLQGGVCTLGSLWNSLGKPARVWEINVKADLQEMSCEDVDLFQAILLMTEY